MEVTPLQAARFRAESLRKVRDFFRDRNVLEVETPILSRGISLDCHIDVFSTQFHPDGYARRPRSPTATGTDSNEGERFFLQTSPEPHMKRLLCAGFPDIYQISKAFRNGEIGRRHNPEFTMLEWYRRGYTLDTLMDEVEEVCRLVAGPRPVLRKTYREAFTEALGADPLELTAESIPRLPALAGKIPDGHRFSAKADALDFALTHGVEPTFPVGTLVFIRDFPAEQAAQAQFLKDDPRLAHRFEVYAGGGHRNEIPQKGSMELGNGYLELLDPAEYSRRFEAENDKRRTAGKPELPVDGNLLRALENGLPACAGVAMGFDRLVMLGLGSADLGPALSFSWQTA